MADEVTKCMKALTVGGDKKDGANNRNERSLSLSSDSTITEAEPITNRNTHPNATRDIHAPDPSHDITFVGTNYAELNIDGGTFTNVRFTNCKMADCLFVGCNFEHVKFEYCNFTGVRFHGVTLREVKYEECRFKHALWVDIIKEEAYHCAEMFDKTIIDESVDGGDGSENKAESGGNGEVDVAEVLALAMGLDAEDIKNDQMAWRLRGDPPGKLAREAVEKALQERRAAEENEPPHRDSSAKATLKLDAEQGFAAGDDALNGDDFAQDRQAWEYKKYDDKMKLKWGSVTENERPTRKGGRDTGNKGSLLPKGFDPNAYSAKRVPARQVPTGRVTGKGKGRASKSGWSFDNKENFEDNGERVHQKPEVFETTNKVKHGHEVEAGEDVDRKLEGEDEKNEGGVSL